MSTVLNIKSVLDVSTSIPVFLISTMGNKAREQMSSLESNDFETIT